MKPIKFVGMNTNFVAQGSDDLPAMVTNTESGTPEITSAWEPSEEDLHVLQNGGKICLSLYGAQPPVAMWVQEVDTLNEAAAQ